MFKSLVKPHLFCYSHTPELALAAAGAVSPVINISNDADFELLEIRASIHKAASFTGNVMLLLSTSSGDLFSNVAIDLLSFASVEQDSFSGYPKRLPAPVRIPANTVLNVQITNNNGEALVSTQIQLWGYKREPAREY